MSRKLVTWLALLGVGAASFAAGRWLGPPATEPPPPPAVVTSEAAPWKAAMEAARSTAEAGSLRERALEIMQTAEGDVALGDAVRLLGWVGASEDHDLIVSFARSGDPALEMPGIEALGRLGTDSAVDTLVAWLDDRDRDTSAVVAALGLSGHPRAAEVLATRFREPDEAWVAAQALAHFGTPYAAQALAEGLRSGDLHSAGAIARALASMADDVPGASEALYRVLSGPRSGVRTAALAALAEARDPMVYDLLIADLDRGGTGSGQTCLALGHLGDPRAVPRLAREAQEGSSETRYSALQALAVLDHPDADQALLKLVAHGPAPVAARAVHSLPQVDTPEVVVALLDAARTRPREVRQAVLQRLIGNRWRPGSVPPEVLDIARVELQASNWDSWGIDPVGLLLQHGTPEDWALVERALVDGPTHVRNTAVWSLTGLASPEAERLLMLLSEDPDAQVRQSALMALLDRGRVDHVEQRLLETLASGRADYGSTESMLVQLGTERALAAVMGRVEHGTRREWTNAISAIASSGTRSQMEQLLAIADRTDNPELANQILQSLVYSETIPVDDIVGRLLASDDPMLHSTAAQALARTGTPEAKQKLLELVQSDEPQVASSALMSLGQVGGVEAERALVGALEDPDLQWMAVSGLQNIGTPTAREALLDAARSASDPNLRASVLSQVAHLGGGSEETDALLTAALDDDAFEVRTAAIGALESLGTSQAAEVLARQLASGDLEPDDATQVAQALQRMGGEAAERMADEIDALTPDALDTGAAATFEP